MKDKIIDSSKVFESIIRVQMLSSLYVSELTYNELKEICNCSDGNMATHTKKLLAEEFIITKKEFVNNKPQTTYILTEKGKREFLNYVKLLNSLVNQEKEEK
ncbi:transcriptional regulator [Candidatus Stoquefichus sp. SB1]|uniref:transcriptional regulator n=1 Tax=Candidatus Stoquefichus sp. SB1 TaxID=1658109 RepID=UPI00067F2FC7|nr:transcriptional regulator [Candidatus Stoquefichus sp. SB1]